MPPSNILLDHTVTRLYSDHHGWLSGWLRRKLGNSFDAADLAQDTFVRIIRARNAAEIARPREYLATVAKGLMVDFVRRQSLERAYLEVIAHLPEPQMPSVETQAIMMQALLEIDAMLDGLGAKVKQTFILSQFDGLPYAEIAQRLNISLRSVNNHMAKAMEHCCLLHLQQQA